MHEAPSYATSEESCRSDDPRVVDGQILDVDGRSLHVRVSARRSRIGLTVERDGTLTLHTPQECGRGRVEGFLRKNRGWVDGKLLLREGRRPLHPVRELRDGETHRYLGRSYRLLLVDEPDRSASVRLVSGRLRMDRSTAADKQRARRVLADWYCRSGLRWARGRLQPWAARMDVPEPQVAVRDVGRRWGTYQPAFEESERENPADGANETHGRISLHWAVFQLPIHLIDYVIAHELAHTRIAGHGPDYWRLLRRGMPECEGRKTELDEMGRRVWLGDVTERQP